MASCLVGSGPRDSYDPAARSGSGSGSGSGSQPSIPTSTKPPSSTSKPPKRKSTTDFYFTSSTLRSTLRPTKKCPSPQEDMSYMSLHQSTCLNLNGADNSDSDLWILPDFEDWEYDDASPLAHAGVQKGSVITQSSKMTMGKAEQGEWTAFMQRAASSNRERLRRRLEGDGWDFVGGKYGYGTESVEWRTGASVGEEKVDEEFDFVILLPQIAVS